MKKIILGSKSPRRRELLSAMFDNIMVETANNFEEQFDNTIQTREIPVKMAEGKSYGFSRGLKDDEILVTADTMVLVGERILGKPHTRDEAVEMLKALSGKEHEVLSGVTIRDRLRAISFTDSTYVTFKKLTDEEINYYIDHYKPYDKAGAYGVQEWIGYIGITSITGSFYNVMGLPVHRIWSEIQSFLGNE